MSGLTLLLHFGTFQLVGLLWQSFGVSAKPIMSAPPAPRPLESFGGSGGNLGFRQLFHELIFRPLHRTIGAGAAGFLVFAVPGLIHDLVISLPAGGGYGLPTIYFLLQGAGRPSSSRSSANGSVWDAERAAGVSCSCSLWYPSFGSFTHGLCYV